VRLFPKIPLTDEKLLKVHFHKIKGGLTLIQQSSKFKEKYSIQNLKTLRSQYD